MLKKNESNVKVDRFGRSIRQNIIGIVQEYKKIQSYFNLWTFIKVKRSQRSSSVAILNVFLAVSSQICEGHRSLLLRIMSKEAKTTEKFPSKKNGHGTPRYDPTICLLHKIVFEIHRYQLKGHNAYIYYSSMIQIYM